MIRNVWSVGLSVGVWFRTTIETCKLSNITFARLFRSSTPQGLIPMHPIFGREVSRATIATFLPPGPDATTGLSQTDPLIGRPLDVAIEVIECINGAAGVAAYWKGPDRIVEVRIFWYESRERSLRDRKICSGMTEDRRLWPDDTAPLMGQMSNRTPG